MSKIRLVIVFALLALASLCLAEVPPKSRPPRPTHFQKTLSRPSYPNLDKNKLKREYKRHSRYSALATSALTWSPDGRYAFYIIEERAPSLLGEDWFTLFSVRRDGSRISKQYDWIREGAYQDHNGRFTWSPDSKRILMLGFMDTGSVQLDGVDLLDFDVETGERRQLSRDLDGEKGTGMVLHDSRYVAFSPNGKYLLLTLGMDRFTSHNKRLVRIDYATGKRHVLTSRKMASLSGCWSPDGKKIAYIAVPDTFEGDRWTGKDGWEERHLYIMDADGNHQRLLVRTPGYFEELPSWSADGRTISFVRYQTTKQSSETWQRSLWTVRSDGTELTHVRDLTEKEWSQFPHSYYNY